MFTGLVEEVGTVVDVEDEGDLRKISIQAPLVTSDAQRGDSIAVDGVCLTVTALDNGVFSADVMQESLDRSALGAIQPGSPVNLERAMHVGARFGGHIVQGHVDAVAELLRRQAFEHWEVFRFRLPEHLARYVVDKGSITVNGISLTVSAVGDDFFEVSLIPTTLDATTAGVLAVGDVVNLEVDIVAKYVEKMVTKYS